MRYKVYHTSNDYMLFLMSTFKDGQEVFFLGDGIKQIRSFSKQPPRYHRNIHLVAKSWPYEPPPKDNMSLRQSIANCYVLIGEHSRLFNFDVCLRTKFDEKRTVPRPLLPSFWINKIAFNMIVEELQNEV